MWFEVKISSLVTSVFFFKSSLCRFSQSKDWSFGLEVIIDHNTSIK